MSNVFADRVQETTTTTGTGTITTAGAATQFQSLSSGVGNGNTTDYCILSGNGTDWETGNGTVTVGGSTTLSRDTVYASSNSGSHISLSGTSTVFTSLAAPRFNAWSPFGPVISVPRPTSSNTGLTTWANQGSASVADNAVGVTITSPSAGANDSWNIRYKSAPGSTPYSFTALVSLTAFGSGIMGVALGFYDGTKLQLMRVISNTNTPPNIYVSNETNVTTFSSNPFGPADCVSLPVWLKILNDGTNLKYYFSMDGVNFAQLYTNTITNFLANANNVFWGVEANVQTCYGTLMSWAQGTS